MASYQFRPMSAGDLPLVKDWLARPHVTEWWGDTDEQFELVSGDLGIEAMDQFIVAAGERPFAYLQCYDPQVWPENGLGDHPTGTRGIDQFIGEADLLNRGHGSAFIRQFCDTLFARSVPAVTTDPDPFNARAVRAYEKAGFRPIGPMDMPWGHVLLMQKDNAS